MKRLFDENDKYKKDAYKLDNEIHNATSDILKKYVEQGYSVRDIQYIAQQSILEQCLDVILLKNKIY